MDLTPAISISTAAAISTGGGAVKSPEPDYDTPTRIPPITKAAPPFSNGVLKRHHHHTAAAPSQSPPVVYKECLKNHAASLGGHALDGCGEFMPSPTATAADPTSLKCAACGCHRNFHRRESEEPIATPTTTHVIEYQPHHRHHPPPPHRSPSSASPPPISSSYYPSAPHMLLALSGGLPETTAGGGGGVPHSILTPSPNSRKRFRTKFTQNQKDKMYEFAEKVGWKMQKKDDEIIQQFCADVAVDRGVLKVWMHNNKNTLGKKDPAARNINAGDADADDDKINGSAGDEPHAAANGSSSSS